MKVIDMAFGKQCAKCDNHEGITKPLEEIPIGLAENVVTITTTRPEGRFG